MEVMGAKKWKERIRKAAKDAGIRIEKLKQEKKDCEEAIADLQHELELSRLDAVEITQVAILLRDFLRKRRLCKDEIALLSDFVNHGKREALIAINCLENRRYATRKMHGLKINSDEPCLTIVHDVEKLVQYKLNGVKCFKPKKGVFRLLDSLDINTISELKNAI